MTEHDDQWDDADDALGARHGAELDRELDDHDGELGEQLRALLAPASDLGRQTTHHVDRARRGRSVLGTGLDLLGLGWFTVRELLTDAPRPADGEGEGT